MKIKIMIFKHNENLFYVWTRIIDYHSTYNKTSIIKQKNVKYI